MNENLTQEITEADYIDFDQLESTLEQDLTSNLQELEGLELDHQLIGNPDGLGETVQKIVWEQFIHQIGKVAGEDFIKENRNLTLDLRKSSHIQTTENFAEGKIATHNEYIDYQKRYDNWQANFQHNEDGTIKTHPTRTGKQEATLVKGARDKFDKGRPSGSTERGTDIDHIISAGEIIRDPEANAHLSLEEQVSFANSNKNLHEMDSSQNRSKGDKAMKDWLDNTNSKGQKPNEIFDISDELDQTYREKDDVAREEYKQIKKQGENRSIETGKASLKAETFRITGKALHAVLMGMLADLVKEIIKKIVAWFRSANKQFKTFIESIKEAISNFIKDLKQHLLTAGDTLITTIVTAIYGPVIGLIKKAWIFLKQGVKSLKEAIDYLKTPANKNMPFSLKLLQVGKILVAGLTAGGAMVLGEVIEKGLLTIPVFAVQIPLFGSLANILGVFFSSLVSGIIGALALNLIDRLISKKLKQINVEKQISVKNEILVTQEKLIQLAEVKTTAKADQVYANIEERHKRAASEMKQILTKIADEYIEKVEKESENKGTLDEISNMLDNL